MAAKDPYPRHDSRLTRGVALPTTTTSKPLESPRAARAGGSTSGKCQTCAKKRADVHTNCSGCACAWRTSVSSRLPASDAARRRPSLVLLLSPTLAPSFSKTSNRQNLQTPLTPGTACPYASATSAPGCHSQPWSRWSRSCPSACPLFRTKSPGKSADRAGRA